LPSTAEGAAILLSRWEAVHHLLRIGMVTSEELVEGSLKATEYLGRNHLVRIDRSGGCSFNVKQPRNVDMPDSASMWTEAAIFWLSANDSDFELLAPWMPRYFHYREPDRVLTIEYLEAGDSLMAKLMAGPVAPDLLREVGRAFATLHGPVSRALAAKAERRLFAPTLPWVLSFGAAQARYAPPNQAAAMLYGEVARRPEAMAALARVRAEWRSHQIIHGDSKAANVLILDDGSIRVIDWEIAGLGDGLWDLAGMTHSLLLANPMGPAEPLAAAAARARPCLEAFWSGYRAGDSILPAPGDSRDAVLRMTGARIIQTCLESTHATQQASSALAPMLSMAFELLTCPEASREHWRWAA
jgi:tRNA A-37 threonylcarbamoyl transferase component Bud32